MSQQFKLQIGDMKFEFQCNFENISNVQIVHFGISLTKLLVTIRESGKNCNCRKTMRMILMSTSPVYVGGNRMSFWNKECEEKHEELDFEHKLEYSFRHPNYINFLMHTDFNSPLLNWHVLRMRNAINMYRTYG